MSLNIPEEVTQASPSSLVSYLISQVPEAFSYTLPSNPEPVITPPWKEVTKEANPSF